MRKILLAIALLFVMSVSAFGATSDDVYLRRDVFDAKMDALMATMRLENQNMLIQIRKELDERFAKVDEKFAKVDEKFAKVDARFEKVDEKFAKVDERFEKMDARLAKIDERLGNLENRVTGLEQQVGFLGERTEDTRAYVTLVLTLLGVLVALLAAIVAFPFVQKFFQWRESLKVKQHEPLFTSDELAALKRLIATQLAEKM